ncbi:rod-binding protein [Candidatus Nitronereus thalassa]|uniref:Rod-binding protein n=1 Tax=Candidatus Nitronereus thalassa TaxID=3020898 RepID=A0ABU3K642_9BACT|nr:rod-binding protein [Candidatus Nitronereus thalassa]MDT7041865.1 rod-binding protein [Candidatus Nitronereus thalassa]
MISDVGALVAQSADHAVSDGRVEAIKKTIQQGDIKKASEDFEAYFLAFMMKVMRETVPKSTLTQNRMGETFQSFYDEAIGKESAKVGGIGLAQYIESKLREEEVILSQEEKVA